MTRIFILSAALLALAAAVHAGAGETAWQFRTDEPVYCSPAAGGGKVFIGGMDGRMYCVDASGDGSRISWTFETGGAIYTRPALVSGRLFFGSSDSRFYCLDSASGMVLWLHETGGWITGSPFVYRGRVYFGGGDSNFYCLDAQSGVLVWKKELGDMVWGGCVASDDLVYFGGEDNRFYCLNANTGEMLWSKELENSIVSTPVVANGSVYFGCQDGTFYCLDASEGNDSWYFETGAGITSSAVFRNNRVYFASGDGKAYCLEAYAGKVIWTYDTGSEIYPTPLVAGGRVYIGADDGSVYCLDEKKGKKIWAAKISEEAFQSSAIMLDGYIWLGGGDGHVYCIDAGKELRGTNAKGAGFQQPSDDYTLRYPARLNLGVSLDAGEDRVLSTFETGHLNVSVFNTGWNTAFSSDIAIEEITTNGWVDISPVNVRGLLPGAVVETRATVTPRDGLKTGVSLYRVSLLDPFTKTRKERVFRLYTREIKVPAFTAQEGTVDDDNEGESLGNGNRVIEPGEIVEFTIFICNKGEGDALGVKVYPSVTGDFMNYCGDLAEFVLGDIRAGASVKLVLPVVFGKRITEKEGWLEVRITDSRGICEKTERIKLRVK